MLNNKKTYKLSEFAKLAGVSTKSLQRWDKNGVLVADRTDGCHRSYTQEHLDKLRKMQRENSSKLTRRKHFKYKDLTDMRFGKLTVLKRANDWVGPNGHRHIQWLCQCDCGNTVIVKGSSLNAGYNKSCGCSQYGDGDTKRMWAEFEKLSEAEAATILKEHVVLEPTTKTKPLAKPTGVLQDLTGRKFGLWTVLKRAETRHYRGGGQAVCWFCKCECGTVKSVPGRDLKSGASQSCGCLSSMSWLEYHVKNYLIENDLHFEYQKKYNDLQGIGGKLLSYDFLILNSSRPVCVIECQGEQHYRPVKKFGGAKQFLKQQIHDKLKREYAENTLHVPVYEVLYTAMTKEDVYEVMDGFGLK